MAKPGPRSRSAVNVRASAAGTQLSGGGRASRCTAPEGEIASASGIGSSPILARLSSPPDMKELVVISPLNDWTCRECQGTRTCRKRYERQGLSHRGARAEESRGGMPGGRRGASAAQGARDRTSRRARRGACAVDGGGDPEALSGLPARTGRGHRSACDGAEERPGREDGGGEGDGRAPLDPRGRRRRPSRKHALRRVSDERDGAQRGARGGAGRGRSGPGRLARRKVSQMRAARGFSPAAIASRWTATLRSLSCRPGVVGRAETAAAIAEIE